MKCRSGGGPFALHPAWTGSPLELIMHLTFDVTFDVAAVDDHRLEARAYPNADESAVLGTIGAIHEGVLRRSFRRNGDYLDQLLWIALEQDWRQAKGMSL